MPKSNERANARTATTARSTSARSATEDAKGVEKYDSHPLLAEKFFYSLPFTLITQLLRELGTDRFVPELVELELALSRPDGNATSRVGRWHKSWISYELLRFQKHKRAIAGAVRKSSDQDTSRFVRPFSTSYLYSPRRLQRVFQSYLGWLLTNAEFLEEHDDLFKRHIATVRRWGVGREDLPLAQTLFGAPEDDPKRDPAYKSFREQRDEFCFRWRLLRMAGPYLPVPIGSEPEMKVPVTYFISSSEQTGLYLLPDILPVPSRDEIRRSIDEARRRIGEPNHLREWFRIVRSENKARNQLSRFARIFPLQHYWRVVANRHGPALRAATGKLEAVFAEWFDVSEGTVYEDRREIIRRLGRKWQERTWPL